MSALWGIDLGGTKIEGAVVDGTTCQVRFRGRIPTEQLGGYDHIISRIGMLVGQMEQESGLQRPSTIGLSMPGNIERSSGLVKNANTTCLIHQPLLEDLSQFLGTRVIAENDANCFALAEATMGAGAGANVVFGIILGTGVGGGIVVSGKCLPGHQGIAGEWGHNPLVPDGDLCYCGRRGCVETALSGPALERAYKNEAGTTLSLREVAESDSPAAVKIIDRLCEYFGFALGTVINILDPDVVVVGGGVGNIDRIYTDGVEQLRRHVFNDQLQTRVVKPKLGDSAGVFGACMLTSRDPQ